MSPLREYLSRQERYRRAWIRTRAQQGLEHRAYRDGLIEGIIFGAIGVGILALVLYNF